MPSLPHHDDLPPAEEDRPSDWLDVAATVLHHQIRGPWFVGIALLALAGPLIGLVALQLLPEQVFNAMQAFPALSGLDALHDVLPVLALVMTVVGFRGAWLREPGAARARVVGYFAGTWAAVAMALLPWAVASIGVMLLRVSAADAFLTSFTHLVGALLLAAAWIGLGILLAVLFQAPDSQWAAVAISWALLAVVIPGTGDLATYVWQWENDVMPGRAVPPWILVFDALSPSRLHELFMISLGDAWILQPYDVTFPVLFSPYVMGALLAAWAAAPLALAIRLQSRRSEGPF